MKQLHARTDSCAYAPPRTELVSRRTRHATREEQRHYLFERPEPPKGQSPSNLQVSILLSLVLSLLLLLWCGCEAPARASRRHHRGVVVPGGVAGRGGGGRARPRH